MSQTKKPPFILPLILMGMFILASCNNGETVEEPRNIPEWAESVVWYQIFPERFRDGDASNNPTAERVGVPNPEEWEITPWTSDWYAMAEWEQNLGDDRWNSVFYRRYGGDLQGVIDKLDYLQELGITGIYFNPIFDAVTMHKYDASHYHHIDRHFGPDPEGDLEIMKQEDPNDPSTWQWTSADMLFLELLDEARARGIRVVIDGVWNHTGPDFWAFRDIRENGPDSRFVDWYKVIEFGDEYPYGFDYEGWWGYKGLPEFTEVDDDLHPEVKAHIFAVTERWMAPDGDVSRGVDGWRLDVAEEVGNTFWRDWHAHVRSINPEAITIAEIWTDAARDYIAEDMFSVVMNYRWTYAVHDFFIHPRIGAADFGERLQDLLDDFPKRTNLAMQNLMDSHDTERLATMIVNSDRDYKEDSQLRYPGNDYDVRKPNAEEIELQKLIALFQFTSLGSPMVYYGTESGMWGADDPDDRKPMVWYDMEFDDETHHPFGEDRPADPVYFDQDLYDWYSRLAEIRHTTPALQTGNFDIIHAEPDSDVFVFARTHEMGNQAVIAVNRSGETTEVEFTLPGLLEATDLITDTTYTSDEGTLRLRLLPRSGVVLVNQL